MLAPAHSRFSNRHRMLLAAAVAVGVFSLRVPAFADVTLDPSDNVVAFDQLNEGDSDPNAAEGEVTIDVAGALSKLSNPSSGGFLNVADSNGNWLVQNLPIFPSSSPYSSPSVTTRYDLPNDTDGTNVSSENLRTVLSTTTLSAAPSGATNTFTVGDMDFEGGGGGDTGDLSGYEPEGNVTIQGDLNFDAGAIPVLVHYQTQHPNIQAARNQCAPAATANSLDYLRITSGLTITGNPANTTGLRGDGTLVGTLESLNYMDRQGVVSRTTGTGVWPLDGLLKFAATSAGIQTYYAISRLATYPTASGGGGVTLNGTTNRTVAGQTSIALGNTINFNLIDGLLGKGLAVLIDEAWKDVTGKISRHYIQVLGDGTIDNKPFIIFSSDLLQTPKDLSDLRLGNYFPSGTTAGLDSGIEFDWLNGDILTNHLAVVDQVIAIAVPEPASLGMLAAGAMLLIRRRRRV